MMNIDWELLREQKKWLIAMAEFMRENSGDTGRWSQTDISRADGLISLIDAVQDNAVNQGDATDVDVFGETYIVPCFIVLKAMGPDDAMERVGAHQHLVSDAHACMYQDGGLLPKVIPNDDEYYTILDYYDDTELIKI